jgi:hypothetical protein
MGPQLALFTASSEADLFHDTNGRGFFSILVQGETRKHQSSHRMSELHSVLELVDHSRDTWLSQCEFMKPNRRLVNLARIGLLFADLDTYNLPWGKDRSPEDLARSALYLCIEEGVPPPSILIFSGQGLQAKWLLTKPLPRQALLRWNACQRYLVERLQVIGADVAAKDASRVLRVVDSKSSKSGKICRVVHIESGADGLPIRYCFEDLAECLLPVDRWEIEQKRHARANRQKFTLVQGGRSANRRGFSGRQLAWDRLEDLRRLVAIRGGVSVGERMHHLFWRLNFLLLSGATHSSRVYLEAAALAAELDRSWGYGSSELTALYSKAKAYEAGAQVEFEGRQYPALYTPRNSTLISLFRISDQEQRQLRTIISPGIAAERHRVREEERRRAAGMIPRGEFLAAVESRRLQAQSLKLRGLSIRAIAKQMGVSVGAVAGYLKVSS